MSRWLYIYGARSFLLIATIKGLRYVQCWINVEDKGPGGFTIFGVKHGSQWILRLQLKPDGKLAYNTYFKPAPTLSHKHVLDNRWTHVALTHSSAKSPTARKYSALLQDGQGIMNAARDIP